MGARSAERFAHRDALQGVSAGVEDQRVPGSSRDRVRIFRDAPAAEERTRILRRLHDGPLQLFIGREPLDLPGVCESMVEPPIAPDIVVLQIDRAKLRVAPRETVPFPISLEQAKLGHPVELPAERSRIALEPAQDTLPSLDDLPVLRRVVLTVDVLAGQLQVFP